jgi:hypothetical protein
VHQATQAVIELDPDAAADRAETARSGRSVSVVPGRDGMAGLWANLPAGDPRAEEGGQPSGATGTAARADKVEAVLDQLSDLLIGDIGVQRDGDPVAFVQVIPRHDCHVSLPQGLPEIRLALDADIQGG